MKILSFLIFISFSACSFTIQDPLTPNERATVVASKATKTAEASLLSTVTPTPELATPLIEPQIFPELCIVKGNVSGSNGEKIYHIDGQANYSRVIIDPDHGERCFDTEEEAIEAGWRKSQR